MRHISYLSFYESPIGLIRINTSDYAVLSISFVDKEESSNENLLSKRIKKELELYFKGELESFSFYNYLLSGLEAKILEIVSHIPYGEVMTYKEIAKKMGNAGMEKVVMKVLEENPAPILLPCHRVIKDSNDIGTYVGSMEQKKYLLELEQKK